MAVETVTEQVAEGLVEVAQVTRQLDARALKFFGGGTTFGLALGLVFGYRLNREKIKAEEFAKSAEELKKMREYYEQRLSVNESMAKPSVDELVREKGYVVVKEAPVVEEEERPLKPPVPFVTTPSTGIRPIRTAEAEKDKDDGWSYPRELAQRTPDKPYIIHQDEFHSNETGFQQVTYSYYAGDGVMTDEQDNVIGNVQNLIGEDNLRWGHGSDDMNVVHIRNSELELEFEVCRTPKSYEQEVLGLEHSDHGEHYEQRRRRHKGRRDARED
jgi:hypothetical protein